MKNMSVAPTATSVEPTARSMPPEMMTRHMPSATMPTVALLRRMLIQLRLQWLNHAPKLSNSKPSATVCRIIIRISTSAVENRGLFFHWRCTFCQRVD